MSLTKTLFDLLMPKKPSRNSKQELRNIKSTFSRDELREFLINNSLQGELLKSVNELKEKYSDLSNYQAVEYLMDYNESSTIPNSDA